MMMMRRNSAQIRDRNTNNLITVISYSSFWVGEHGSACTHVAVELIGLTLPMAPNIQTVGVWAKTPLLSSPDNGGPVAYQHWECVSNGRSTGSKCLSGADSRHPHGALPFAIK